MAIKLFDENEKLKNESNALKYEPGKKDTLVVSTKSNDSLISLEFNTKLFRHYKNKPYRLLSVGKHSETLEEYVVYEALYPESAGQIWVRPKEMFFGLVSIGPRQVSRFEQVPLFIRTVSQLSSEDIGVVKHLCELCFGEWNERNFLMRLSEVKKPLLILSYIDSIPVGFKMGYELDEDVFYSWLGGVAPAYRKLGFAQQMARYQIENCRMRNYKKVHMKTRNRFPEMISMNLKLGFKIQSVEARLDGDRDILMELDL
jgi:hypothetical protein